MTFAYFQTGCACSGGHYLPVQVQVLLLDQGGNIINTSEANLNLDLRTLGIQINYLTYLDLTDPTPAGAVAARILFTPTIEEQQSFFTVDQVLLARAGSGNLVENPSFESGADGWTLVNAAGNCYLLSFGLRVVSYGPVVNSSDVLIKVLWLDERGREIGVGLNVVAFVLHPDTMFFGQWLVYTGITEEAPVGTAAARLQFSKPAGGIAPVEIDHVVFGRLV